MNEKDGINSTCCCAGDTMAFLLLRGWLAVRAILTGIEKFGAYKTIQQPLIDPDHRPAGRQRRDGSM